MKRDERIPLADLLTFRPPGEYDTYVFDFDGVTADTMPALRALAVAVLVGSTSWSPTQAARRYDVSTGMPFGAQLEIMLPGEPGNQKRGACFERCKVALMRYAAARAEVVPILE